MATVSKRAAEWAGLAAEVVAIVLGLLIAAHYRTCPNDLRRLLDDADHRLFARFAGEIPIECAVYVIGK